MRMLNNNVLLREVVNNGETTPEGVILPETITQQYELGIVVAVPEGVNERGGDVATNLEPGNLVAYHANAGVRIRVNGTPCRMVLEGNVLAVLMEDALTNEDAPEPADDVKH